MMIDKSAEEREYQLAIECVNRRQFHPRKAKSMNNVVARIMSETGVGQTQSQQQIRNAWTAAAGKAIATVTAPGKLRRGVLEIIVESSAVMQQLVFKKSQLLLSINDCYNSADIKDLRFKVGVVPR